MTTFIAWGHDIDAAFRARYLEITGEAVQDFPENSGTHYLIGSSRVTQEHMDILHEEFYIHAGGRPDWFIPLAGTETEP